VDFDACWWNVHSAFLCPKLRDLSWRMAHDILPLNAKLHRQNRVLTDRCPLCKRDVENQLHLFLLCGFTKPLLGIVDSAIRDITGGPVLIDRGTLFFNLFRTVKKEELPIVLLVWAIYKQSVWTVRNLVKKERRIQTPADILTIFTASLKFRFLVDLKRFKEAEFKKYWDHRGALCSQVNEDWQFVL
jgi:hypothetical protein